jgi:hypothetical protein
MSEHQKDKMKRAKIGTHAFICEQEDARGNRHRFFDFKAFSNFIEDEDSASN